MLRLIPNLALQTCADLQSTISNHRWESPLVLSSIPPMPLDNRIRMVLVRSLSCAVISREILYGCPVLDLVGSVVLLLCSALKQGDVAPSSRRPALQSILDPIAPFPCVTLQPPTGLCSPQPPQSDASGALAHVLPSPNSYLAAPHWRPLPFRPECSAVANTLLLGPTCCCLT
jgi:hypothetical protein